ncbi:MAG: ferredoxin [Tissierellia bacterium]|jgi:uncharacterized ferredoxin-like protein|nr:DUF2148 domain-containing protein [Bacillota bacterium]NLL23266.1 ferredoxin [Tissierellia bacterium]
MIREKESLSEILRNAAYAMMSRARTAPKIKGLDLLEMILIEGKEVQKIADEIVRLGTLADLPYYIRDAQALEKTGAILLIGSKDTQRDLDQCRLCGYKECSLKPDHAPCAMTAMELGIALGSALSAAMDYGIDSRLMLSAAKAAQSLGIFSQKVHTAIALPMSISSKNIYFDRS